MTPQEELIQAVFQLVRAYRSGSASELHKSIHALVDVWEKHPRAELREMMDHDRSNKH